MAKLSQEEFRSILKSADLSGFTKLLKGKKWRYVIGLTHNLNWTVAKLVNQAKKLNELFKSLTIWWRLDEPEGNVVIDIGTTCDDLKIAIALGVGFKQKCIRDSLKQKEIPIKSGV